MNNNLVDIVKKDISTFLERNRKLFFNERNFQMHLSTYLLGIGNYDEVFLEYYVPKTELQDYVWNSKLYLDIVIRKGNEYLPIELKYKTKKISEKKLKRFGEDLGIFEILKNQGAQNLGKYNFWKDVRRLELLRDKFSTIHNGIAVFVTNDEYYTKSAKDSGVSPFDMNEGDHGTDKSWNKDLSCAETYPKFEVEKCYSIEWRKVELDSEQFYYCILVV